MSRSVSRSTKALATLAASTFAVSMSADRALAQFQPLLDTGDFVIGIDANGQTAHGRYPAAENPPKALDNTAGTKYLNFGGRGSGFIVTPADSMQVESFQIRTGNDAPARDPASWQLFGYNGALTSVDSGPTPAINPSGLAEPWTLIDSGAVALPGDPAIGNDQRGVLGPIVNVNGGGVTYQHYKIVFPTLKTQFADIMQIADVQFYNDEAATVPILQPADPVIATNFGFESRTPANEIPARVIDGLATTKYLNFGRENSGVIVTNSTGPVAVGSMGLTTANDAADRDPASYELWATNDAIQSQDNSDGLGGENWVLISSGSLALPGDIATDDFRGVQTIIPIDETPDTYSSYKIIFPTVKNAAGANSMQIADIQFYTVPEPSILTAALGGLGLLAARRRRRA